MSPAHPSLLGEIVRFNREAPALLGAPDAETQTLGDFLESRRFSEGFTHRYLFLMASAIWSASLDGIRSFPALTLIRFFDNHGLAECAADVEGRRRRQSQPHSEVRGATLGRRLRRRRDPAVARTETAVTIAFRNRPSMVFDEVVFACHGDQVLPLLHDERFFLRSLTGSDTGRYARGQPRRRRERTVTGHTGCHRVRSRSGGRILAPRSRGSRCLVLYGDGLLRPSRGQAGFFQRA
jgi:predicted NAD/FAD-binding protein